MIEETIIKILIFLPTIELWVQKCVCSRVVVCGAEEYFLSKGMI